MNNRLNYKLLIALLFSTYIVVSQAQEIRPRAVEAGFCVGPTIGWVSIQTDGYESSGAKIGGFYGINADINLLRTKEVYFFSTGIVFNHLRLGLNYKDNYNLTKKEEIIPNADITSTYSNMYLSIPTAIKLKTEHFSNFAIFGEAGFSHSFRISSKSKDKIIRENKTEEKDDKVNQDKNMAAMRETVFAVLGVEYVIHNNTKTYFGMAYNYGLSNVFKRKYRNEITQNKVVAHSHTIEFQFGFIF